MTKILRLDTSIKGTQSVSLKLAEKITAKLGGDVTVRDCTALPAIDGAWIGAAYTPAETRTADQKALLALSDDLIAELKAVDTVVIGCGVYNFGVTGPLKHWIDMVCRVGETFKYTETGPVGLAGDKRVIAAYASGGVPMGSAYDFATPYLKQVLGFIGITRVEIVAAQGVNLDEAAAFARADEQIAALAA
ncbi:FMN-dependent NADH-azoreductase [Paenirhodobacter sp.]|uniref:FMN-dependent NADH-azoreductase n=1 Tax=Paenirhodobacter sp. TaxID=1965326 RepID=UPI003B3D0398